MAVVVGIIFVVSLTYHQLIGRFPRGRGRPGSGRSRLRRRLGLPPPRRPAGRLHPHRGGQLRGRSGGADRLRPRAGGGPHGARPRPRPARRRRGPCRAPRQDRLRPRHPGLPPDGAGRRRSRRLRRPRRTPAAPRPQADGTPLLADASLAAVLLAFPLGMALATGVEAPSNAIAQLPQLGDSGRRRFGRRTLWLMVGIVGALTIAVAALAVRLDVGLPDAGLDPACRHCPSGARGTTWPSTPSRPSAPCSCSPPRPPPTWPAPACSRRSRELGLDGRAGLLPEPLRRENQIPRGALGSRRRPPPRDGDDPRRPRPRAGARPVLRRLGLRQLPRRDPGLRPAVPSGRQARRPGREPPRRRSRHPSSSPST